MEAVMGQIHRSWTTEDNAKIRSLAGKVSLPELARHLNRTEGATRVQASKLGIKITLVRADKRDNSAVKRPVLTQTDAVEQVTAPVAIERALSIYQQLQEREQSVMLQARKILTQHIYGMVDQGESDERRLTVGGLVHLRAIERDHAIKSAHGGPRKRQKASA
jgi:hypothetical protein